MKQALFTIIFWSFISPLIAQNVSIYGNVVNEQGVPLIGATVQINDHQGTATDIDGGFYINYEGSNSFNVTIRYLGYSPFDTLVNTTKTEIRIDAKLSPSKNTLPEIEISDKSITSIINKEQSILDFNVDSLGIIVLSRNLKDKFISKYSTAGFLQGSLIVDKGYHRFHRSHNNLHLVGNKACAQINSRFGDLSLNEYSLHNFKTLIQKNVLQYADQFVFKEFSSHNKRATYFYYPKPSEPRLICKIHDKDAEKVARSYYREIIGTYHQTIENLSESNISYGMPQHNIIKQGEWDGDLLKLMVSNELQQLISYYLTVESRQIATAEFVVEDQLLIFDLINLDLYIYDRQFHKAKKVSLEPHDVWQKCKIIQDKRSETLYLLNRQNEVFRMEFDRDIQLTKVGQIRNTSGIVSKVLIDNNTVYYLLKNTHNPLSKIITYELN